MENQSVKEKHTKKHKFKWPETSKLIAIYLFLLLNVVIGYTLVAMWKFEQFTYLGVLITDIAAQVLVYAIYCLKAYNAKKQEEFIKFEREKFSGDLDEVIDSGRAETNNIMATEYNPICDSPVYEPTTVDDFDISEIEDTSNI